MQALGGLDPRPFELLPLNDAPNPLSGGNCALCQVVAPGAAHDIGDHKACESAEDSGSHAVELWISAPVTEHGNSATRPMEYIAAHHQRRSADDSDCTFQVLGKDVKAHFGSDVGQPPCPEVVPPHPVLDRAEDVLDDAAPRPHGVGHFVQAPLHGFDHRLVFPTGDAALLAWSALGLHRAGAAIAGPVPAERQPVLDGGVAPDQLLACRAAVGVGFGLIDEVLFPEAPARLRA